MDFQKTYQRIHNKIEGKEGRRISNREMSERLGCTVDTYSSSRRGEKKHESIERFIDLLNYLSDEEIVKIIRENKKEEHE